MNSMSEERKKSRNMGWRRLLPSDIYHKLSLSDYPTFDINDENDQPYFLRCYFVSGTGESSRSVAIEFDDVATGAFYYRDYTGGLPFIYAGDEYVSVFTFQLKEDYKEFIAMYKHGPCSPESKKKADEFMSKVYASGRIYNEEIKTE